MDLVFRLDLIPLVGEKTVAAKIFIGSTIFTHHGRGGRSMVMSQSRVMIWSWSQSVVSNDPIKLSFLRSN